MTEADIQGAIVEYLRTVLPDGLTFAIPNASRRTELGYATNAVPGIVPGMADLCHVRPGGRALFIEVKSPGGHLRSEQAAMQLRCMNMGAPYGVARSIDDVRRLLAAWGIATREAKLSGSAA